MMHISNYNLREKCGEGIDGIVWKAVKKDDATVCAIKILSTPLKDIVVNEDGVPKEVEIMESLSIPGHTNVVKYYGWGTINRYEMMDLKNAKYCNLTSEGVFIVMEWIEGVTLECKIKDHNFGKNKRRQVYKQLLDAVMYINSLNISHGSLFLDNILITKSSTSSSPLPRVVVCDFGSACHVTPEPQAQLETKFDRDRRQCGGVLFALFSSANINSQITTNKLMQRDAFNLARDLIGVRKPITLESALTSPFLFNLSPGDKFEVQPSALWNEDIVEGVADCIIKTGSVTDFVNSSLVCKQFFTIFQRRFLCEKPFLHLEKPFEYEFDYLKPPLNETCEVEEWCLWFERVPYYHTWETLKMFSEGDMAFEQDLLQSYFESMRDYITQILTSLLTFNESTQPWNDIHCNFHLITGTSGYVGQESIRYISRCTRNRMKHWIGKTKTDFGEEKRLIIRMLTLILESMRVFLEASKDHMKPHGLTLQVTSDLFL